MERPTEFEITCELSIGDKHYETHGKYKVENLVTKRATLDCAAAELTRALVNQAEASLGLSGGINAVRE
jgi:hypothetical protein